MTLEAFEHVSHNEVSNATTSAENLSARGFCIRNGRAVTTSELNMS